jgi:hypothetical protein
MNRSCHYGRSYLETGGLEQGWIVYCRHAGDEPANTESFAKRSFQLYFIRNGNQLGS